MTDSFLTWFINTFYFTDWILYQKLFIQHASGLSLLKQNNYLPAYDTPINTLEYHLPATWKSTYHVRWLIFTFWSIIAYRTALLHSRNFSTHSSDFYLHFVFCSWISSCWFQFTSPMNPKLKQSNGKGEKELAPGLPLEAWMGSVVQN